MNKSRIQIKEFYSNAAHELKTPLTIIIFQLDILNDHFSETALEIMQSEIHRLAHVIENFEILMKTESELNRYQKLIEEKSLTVDVQNIPGTEITGEPHWLKIMISNLLENAIKFAPVAGNIVISNAIDDNEYRLTNINDMEHHHKVKPESLTERFYRGKSDQSGSGLGLSIVKWIVDQHDGSLHFDVSATFTVVVRMPI